MATKITVTYRDGTVSEGYLTPRALMAYERKYGAGADAPRLEGSYYAAWSELRPDDDFETWIDSVLDYSEESVPTVATAQQPPSPPSP